MTVSVWVRVSAARMSLYMYSKPVEYCMHMNDVFMWCIYPREGTLYTKFVQVSS